jgi:anti-anti-sigma regulatory factor
MADDDLDLRWLDGLLLVRGDIDFRSVGILLAEAEARFPPGAPVILDLSAVPYMDSGALSR